MKESMELHQVPMTPVSSRSLALDEGCGEEVPIAPMLCDNSDASPTSSPTHSRRKAAKSKRGVVNAAAATHKVRSPPTANAALANGAGAPLSSWNELEAPETPLAFSPPKRRYIPPTPSSYFSPQRRSSIASALIPEPSPSPSPLRRLLRASSEAVFNTPQSVKSTLSRTLGAPFAPLLQIPSPLASPRTSANSRRDRAHSIHSVSSALSDLSAATEIDSIDSSQEEELLPEQVLPRQVTQEHAQEIIQRLEQIKDKQDKRDEELRRIIEQEKQLAKARYLHGNETGAILAMKKINRLQQERTRVTVASDVASDSLVELKRAMAAAAETANPNATVEISEDSAYVLQEVHEVLAGTCTVVNNRNELLRQVREL